MISTNVTTVPAQTVNPAPVRLVYRKPIVGGLVEATVIRDSGDWLRVEVPGEPYHKSIHVTDIVSWILDTDAPAANASQSPKTAPSCDSVPARSPRPFAIQPIDPARALARYSHLAAERHCRLEGDRLYYAIPCTWADSQAEIAKSSRALSRAEHHVARVEALARGEQPSPWCQPAPIMYLPAMFKSMFAWMTLERWRNEGKPAYTPTAEEQQAIAAACKCGNEPAYCDCKPAPEIDDSARRGYNPFSLMIAR